MEKILLAQFIAHIVADFSSQPECVSRKKQENIFRSWHIYIHSLVVFAASAVLTPTLDFIVWSAVIAVLHLGTDVAKIAIERRMKDWNEGWGGGRLSFFVDQILHITVIWAAVWLYVKNGGIVPEYLEIFTTHRMLVAMGFLLCLKPANIFIRVCLSSLGTNRVIGDSLQNESLQKAGRWIGSIGTCDGLCVGIVGSVHGHWLYHSGKVCLEIWRQHTQNRICSYRDTA